MMTSLQYFDGNSYLNSHNNSNIDCYYYDFKIVVVPIIIVFILFIIIIIIIVIIIAINIFWLELVTICVMFGIVIE